MYLFVCFLLQDLLTKQPSKKTAERICVCQCVCLCVYTCVWVSGRESSSWPVLINSPESAKNYFDE